MPPAGQAEPSTAKSGSRHKDRKMVAFRSDVYQMVRLLALRGNRDLARQVRIISIQALREAGLWPPTEELLAELARRLDEDV